MNKVLKTRVTKTRHSLGIVIPNGCLEQLRLHDEVELAVESDCLVIRPARRPRQGWAEQFRAMAARGDDKLLDESTPTEWDKAEWEW